MQGYREYVVKDVVAETPTVTTFYLMPKNGEVPAFIPGQFVNAILPQFGPEAKSYSIASIPEDGMLALAIRPTGEFSRTLAGLARGNTLQLSEPCGFFYAEDETTPRIFVAGGIGIVPFISMLRSAHEKKTKTPTMLLYSNRLASDRPFLKELVEHQEAGRCTIRHFVTGEREGDVTAFLHRIGPDDLSSARDALPSANFFLCGGIEFVRDMRLALKSIGVSEDSIFTEAFF